MRKMLTPLRNKKGFTLMELLVCMIIAGLLIAVSATAYNNIIGDSSPRAAALGVAKDMQEMFNMSQKAFADTTVEPANLAALVTAGYLTAIATPPAQASSAAYTWDTTSYNGWTNPANNDTAVKLTGVSLGACQKINELFAGAAANVTPPAAINYSAKMQCFGAGPTYTAVQPIFAH